MLAVLILNEELPFPGGNARIKLVLVSRRSYERSLRTSFALLDGEERERAWCIRQTYRRTAFIAAHAWRRLLLSSLVRDVSPDRWLFLSGSHGRPIPVPMTEGCDASLSYAGDFSAIAATRHSRVGIDMELLPSSTGRGRSGGLFGTDRHRRTGWPDDIEELERWASYEAVAKCIGVGIGGEFPFTAVSAPPLDPGQPVWNRVPEAGVMLRRQTVSVGSARLALAVAVGAG